MSYELVLTIPDGSPEEYNIESLVEAEHISREEAARKLLASCPGTIGPSPLEAKMAAINSLTGCFKNKPSILEQLWQDRRDDLEQEERRSII